MTMDVAYNQHSPHSRHNARSSTNLNHLTLAPLTSRLPLSDGDAVPDSAHHISYLEGRSAPTTPSILSRSSSRVSVRKPHSINLPKSKSSTQLLATRPRPGSTTPGATRLRKGVTKDGLSLSTLSSKDNDDADWLLRAGAAMSSSARESKGQAWLVSRASSTSLSGQLNEDQEELERELVLEKEIASRNASRRGSAVGAFDADDEFSPATTRRRSLSFGLPTGSGSRPISRFGSRGNSRRGSRVQLYTPGTSDRESYFNHKGHDPENYTAEPDFVDVEEDGYGSEIDEKDDEAVVKGLARMNSLGLAGWVERMLGWSLFAVDEDGEETEVETSDDRAEDSETSLRTPRKAIDGNNDLLNGERLPPPANDEAGGWNDAAWLLSVATKVLL